MAEPNSLRIFSYNIHKGFAAANRRYVLPAIKDAVLGVGADLVFLQEVIGENRRHAGRIADWGERPQCEYLADRAFPHMAYGRNVIHRVGDHGNAILSRHPILSFENHDVSTNRFERRGILHAVIDQGGGHPLHAVCVHLGLTQAGRSAQVRQLCEKVIAGIDPAAPVILAGDFNDWSLKASRDILHHTGIVDAFRSLQGREARTFPARLPLLRLDRVYTRHFQIAEARVLNQDPWRRLSDHAALLVDVTLPPTI